MGVRCIIDLDQLIPHGPINITYDDDPDVTVVYAQLPDWSSPGELYANTVEFDFNAWGTVRLWLMPWLINNRVPFRIA